MRSHQGSRKTLTFGSERPVRESAPAVEPTCYRLTMAAIWRLLTVLDFSCSRPKTKFKFAELGMQQMREPVTSEAIERITNMEESECLG